MRLGDIGCRLVAPGNRVDVKTIARIARTLSWIIEIEFKRGDPRSLADFLGSVLIGRGREPNFHARTRAIPGVNTCQPDCRSSWVVAGSIAERVGLQVRETGEDVDVV